jgi:electron transfer flavoprotein alpha/beta subunit
MRTRGRSCSCQVERTLKPGDGTLDRASADGVIKVLDEYAIEEGPQIAITGNR